MNQTADQPSSSTDPAELPAVDAVAPKRGWLGVDWSDPNVPAGNAPALPRWPLWLASVVWLGWLTFLVLMAAVRLSS